jgi:hypothetical protein
MKVSAGGRCLSTRFLLCGAALCLAIPCFPGGAAAQDTYVQPSQEIVVNLAAGRVIIAVVKDAILIATIENPVEPATRPPTPVEVSSLRAGIILGADQWLSPATRQELALLDRELPHLRRNVASSAALGPHLQAAAGGDEATDVESFGQGLLERLNALAGEFHNKLPLAPDEPIAQVIFADYLPGYGPEVWHFSFTVEQTLTEHEDYWNTRVKRPQYEQIYPPEKKQPKTLMEFDYPAAGSSPTVLEMLRQKDPRVQALVSSDANMIEVANRLLAGESNKILAVDATQFFRALIDAITPKNARQTMAVIKPEAGFQWVLQPPAEATPPSAQQKPREAGAPSLASPSPHLQQ